MNTERTQCPYKENLCNPKVNDRTARKMYCDNIAIENERTCLGYEFCWKKRLIDGNLRKYLSSIDSEIIRKDVLNDTDKVMELLHERSRRRR